MHMFHYVRPELQMYYIRILWMVPIYAVESWFSLRFKEAALYIETARECYEAYVIYSFFYLMLAYLASVPSQSLLESGAESVAEVAERENGVPAAAASLGAVGEESPRTERALTTEEILADDAKISSKLKQLSESASVPHRMPLCCLPPWKMGSEFFHHTRAGVFQYVLVKVFTSILTVILESRDLYDEGNFHAVDRGYLWIALIVNFSQMYALYCLVLFYFALKTPLSGIRPVGKFLVVKAVVFVSWWQGVVISGFVFLGWIQPTLSYDADEIASGLQDFLICIEMFFAAIAHHFVFSYRDVFDPHAEDADERWVQERQPFRRAAVHMLPTDVLKNTTRVLGPRQRSTVNEIEIRNARKGDDYGALEGNVTSD